MSATAIRPASRETLLAFADSLAALREANRRLGGELEWQPEGCEDSADVAAAREREQAAFERCRDLAATLCGPHVERETPANEAHAEAVVDG